MAVAAAAAAAAPAEEDDDDDGILLVGGSKLVCQLPITSHEEDQDGSVMENMAAPYVDTF